MKSSTDIIERILDGYSERGNLSTFPNLGFYEEYPKTELETIENEYKKIIESSGIFEFDEIEIVTMIIPNNTERLQQCLDRYSGINSLRNTAINGICIMDFSLCKDVYRCDLSLIYEYIIENENTARFIFVNVSDILRDELLSWKVCEPENIFTGQENTKGRIGFI